MNETVLPQETRLLLARIRDGIAALDSGMASATPFLNPGEQYFAGQLLRESGRGEQGVFFGGYPEAERRRLLLLPDYATDILGFPPVRDPAAAAACYAGLDAAPVYFVRIVASGFCSLSHRDYMGSILALGIERDTVGDIVVLEDGALVCTVPHMATFLCAELHTVGRDSVRVRISETLPPDFVPAKRTEALSDTVASPRLDCVVAALAHLSREAAQKQIRQKLVDVNYRTAEEDDTVLTDGDVLSVRGVGKFRILSLTQRTRRDRLRLEAEKYI